jgi:dihydroorotate dehydrogenase
VYRTLFRLLTKLPAEAIHEAVFFGLRTAMALPLVDRATRRALAPSDPRLAIDALGTTFAGPVGLAAGFDKDALGPDALTALGFAFVEIGTVTPLAQPGNPKPRVFRLPLDRALVNRMGFPSRGAAVAAANLARRSRSELVGVNVGKNKATDDAHAAADFANAAAALAKHARFCVVNVSSPNTPGLRALQKPEALRDVLVAVRASLDGASPDRRVPLLVKIAPDLGGDDIDAIAALVRELGLDGVVAVNTTVARADLSSDAATVERIGAGGLSGAPLRPRALEVLVRLRAALGPDVVLVSVGGIADVEDAWERITHGAALLELYTGFVYEGPMVAKRIHDGLVRKLEQHGFATLRDAVGSALRPAPEAPRPTNGAALR